MSKPVICFNCSASNPVLGSVGFRDECFKCGSDLHCCRNCAHYDPGSYNDCREPSAEVVREKDRANFCDYFSPGDGSGAGKDRSQELLSNAEALFKKKD